MNDKIGRPANILSIGFKSLPPERILGLIDETCREGTDIVLLPETCLGDAPLSIGDALVDRFREKARALGAYVLLPFFRQTSESKRLNTALLIDREGRDAGTYDKVFPYWSEFDMQPPAAPGGDAPVFETDFGKVGCAICFDANFPEVFKRLSDNGAELVFWPSAYSAGLSLQAHAINYNFIIVTCTFVPDCAVYDITGRETYYQRSEGEYNISRVEVDLDRCVFHENFNMEARERILRERADEIESDVFYEREQWFTLRAKKPGVSARVLAKEYNMEELRSYKRRSERGIDALRGYRFVGKTI